MTLQQVLTTTFDARWSQLPALTEWTTSVRESLELTTEQAFILDLVVEEIVTNVIKYGYLEQGGPLELCCTLGTRDQHLEIVIRDRGAPFDPTQAEQPNLSANVQQRPVGGLGVFLVCEMADTIGYTHDETTGWNELRVTKAASTDQDITPLIEFLQRMPLFAPVDPVTLTELVQSAHHLRLAPGEVLFHEGDPGDECFIVVAGDVDVIKELTNETILLERCRPGAIIGEMALIDNSPRAASVRARTAATLLRITEAEFITLMHANPTTAIALLRGGTARLRGSTSRMIKGLQQKNTELEQAYENLKAAQAELLRLERIERELAIARDIQRFFLPPSIPQPAGWQIAAYNEGALEVGGDFYDVLALHDQHIGLVVADACGKGVPAALFVALTRSLLRSAAQALAIRTDGSPDPAELITTAMDMTNTYIAREHGASNMFTTMFFGILDPTTGTLTYTNAGHNPPIIYNTTTGELRLLDASGLPLGILEKIEHGIATTGLASDEYLLAFTDGATEAFDGSGGVFDDAALLEVIRGQHYHDATSLIEAVQSAIKTFVGTAPPTDDITLLAVHQTSAS